MVLRISFIDYGYKFNYKNQICNKYYKLLLKIKPFNVFHALI